MGNLLDGGGDFQPSGSKSHLLTTSNPLISWVGEILWRPNSKVLNKKTVHVVHSPKRAKKRGGIRRELEGGKYHFMKREVEVSKKIGLPDFPSLLNNQKKGGKKKG